MIRFSIVTHFLLLPYSPTTIPMLMESQLAKMARQKQSIILLQENSFLQAAHFSYRQLGRAVYSGKGQFCRVGLPKISGAA